MYHALENLIAACLERKIYNNLPRIMLLILILSSLAHNFSYYLGQIPEFTGKEDASYVEKLNFVFFKVNDFIEIGYKTRENGKNSKVYGIAEAGKKYFFVKLPYDKNSSSLENKIFIGRPFLFDNLDDLFLVSDKNNLWHGADKKFLYIEASDCLFSVERFIFVISLLALIWNIFVLVFYLLKLKFFQLDKLIKCLQSCEENSCVFAVGRNFLFLRDLVIWSDENFNIMSKKADELIWAYRREFIHRKIFGKSKKRSYLNLCFTDRTVVSLLMPSNEYTDRLSIWLYECYPIISGYDAKIEKFYKNNPEKLKKLVY